MIFGGHGCCRGGDDARMCLEGDEDDGGCMRCEASSTESRLISNELPAATLKRGDAAAEEALEEEPSDCRRHALLLSCA